MYFHQSNNYIKSSTRRSVFRCLGATLVCKLLWGRDRYKDIRVQASLVRDWWLLEGQLYKCKLVWLVKTLLVQRLMTGVAASSVNHGGICQRYSKSRRWVRCCDWCVVGGRETRGRRMWMCIGWVGGIGSRRQQCRLRARSGGAVAWVGGGGQQHKMGMTSEAGNQCWMGKT